MSALSSSSVSNSEASAAHSSVGVGKDQLLHVLHQHLERDGLASRQPTDESKVKMSPTLAPRSWSSSSGTTPPLPTS